MPSPLTVAQQQVVASRRSDDDAMLAGVAGLALVVSVVAIVFGARFAKKKQSGLAALLFVLGGLSMLSCLGLSALLLLAQFAWH
ncbi:MAG: hypothetical protein Q8N26_16460 [Myxococcales bacterium]|nr:hypothetical protein [Myxococcales bacterium]